MKRLTLLLVSTCILSHASAQDALSPCGTITKNVTLTAGCLAPLVVAASGITVDLGGHSIIGEVGSEEAACLEISGQREVTVRNGTVRGNLCGIVIRGGGSHRLRNLVVAADKVPGDQEGLEAILIADSSDNVLTSITAEGAFEDSGVVLSNAHHNQLSTMKIFGEENPAISVYGNDNVVTTCTIGKIGGEQSAVEIVGSDNLFDRNSISSDSGVSVHVSGDKNVFRRNSVTFSDRGMYADGDENLVSRNSIYSVADGIRIAGDRNAIRENKVSGGDGFVNLSDSKAGCGENAWRRNIFLTDSEGDGPGKGCIR